MGKEAVAKAFDDIHAALAVLNAEVEGTGGRGFGASSDDDPLANLANGCLDILSGAAVVEAGVAGLKALAAVQYADTVQAVAPPNTPVQAQEMAIAAEIGSLLALGGRAAGAFLATSHTLVSSLPLTLSALQAGTISWRHALAMADETASLDSEGAAALEAHFLDPNVLHPANGCPMGEMPASRFRHKARIWRERHHLESIEIRHAKSVADRRVECTPDTDGMAWLSAYLPADKAIAAWNRLTALSRGMQGAGEDRTLTQLRADNFSSALLNSGSNPGLAGDAEGSADGLRAETDTGRRSSIRPQVLVTVPVFTLMGLTDEPAVLDGFGPIPASMARKLVADGADSFHRVLVDPRDGAPLEIGRTSYRVTKAMRNWLRMRDGKCPFPGCSNNSLDNEADHLLAWHKGGTTGISNLGQPCPKHHRLRHTSAWKPTPATKDEPPGWISPSGRHYKSEHQDWEPPHWPFIHLGGSPAEDDISLYFRGKA
jgi:hypothetical protein